MWDTLFSFNYYYKKSRYAHHIIWWIAVFCALSVLVRFCSGPMTLKDFLVNFLTAIFGGYLWCLIVKFTDHFYYKQKQKNRW